VKGGSRRSLGNLGAFGLIRALQTTIRVSGVDIDISGNCAKSLDNYLAEGR